MAQQTLGQALDSVYTALDAPDASGLTAAIASMAHALTALAQRVEAQNRILARVESHLAQEGRWTAAALTAAHLNAETHRVQSAQDAQEAERAIRAAGRKPAPPADSPVVGLLARLSSDHGRATDGAELPVRAVAIALDTTADFLPLRERMTAHAQHCDHTRLSDCIPMLSWLATDGRFARILMGTSADELLRQYDAEQAS